MVTYVALLMFLQFGSSETMAALYSGSLFLPWMLKSYLYTKVKKAGSFKRYIHLVEVLMFLCLMAVAVYLTDYRVRDWVLFLFLFLLSLLCAWHEMLTRLYYSRMLFPREQLLFGNTKMLASQVTLVVTYGVLIIIAGFFEVFFRSYQKAWAMESSLVAGVFLIVCVLNFLILQNPRIYDRYRYESIAGAVKEELKVIERIRQKPHVFRVLVALFLLLLPQALMFNPRVFFLLASSAHGGLDCSVQDVGFAQGTIGVIAFSIGLGWGRYCLFRYGRKRMFWLMAVVLTLSPLFYMVMALAPQPGNLPLLCVVTFLTQICFGGGLNVCRVFVDYISDQRYRNAINYLYVPMVASVMLVPMMVSGWLCATLGYGAFFTLCIAVAPIAWLVIALCRIEHIIVKT